MRQAIPPAYTEYIGFQSPDEDSLDFYASPTDSE